MESKEELLIRFWKEQPVSGVQGAKTWEKPAQGLTLERLNFNCFLSESFSLRFMSQGKGKIGLIWALCPPFAQWG